MKTPREVLLEQNREHDARLGNIQRHVIANSLQNRAQRLGVRQSSAAFGMVCQKLWAELVLPARRIWLAYAFVWLAIAAFYIATADYTVTRIAKNASSSEAAANWKEQRMILAELTRPNSHDPVDRPKQQPIGPRSEARAIAIG